MRIGRLVYVAHGIAMFVCIGGAFSIGLPQVSGSLHACIGVCLSVDALLFFSRRFIVFYPFPLGFPQLMAPALVMEVSTIFLNLRTPILGSTYETTVDALFVFTFFVARMIVAPFLWAQGCVTMSVSSVSCVCVCEWEAYTMFSSLFGVLCFFDPRLMTYYGELARAGSSCFDPSFIYVVWFGGCVFHPLNLYWFVQIISVIVNRTPRTPAAKDQ